MGIEEALKGLKTADISLTSGPEQLRGAIQQLGFKVDDIESQGRYYSALPVLINPAAIFTQSIVA